MRENSGVTPATRPLRPAEDLLNSHCDPIEWQVLLMERAVSVLVLLNRQQ